ncbi:unnamed protein product [Amoebophrya sp. A120]|nr:unnamed protein product [Amoebophrya sp. A120]|eukprot:GSA120T00012575001.1
MNYTGHNSIHAQLLRAPPNKKIEHLVVQYDPTTAIPPNERQTAVPAQKVPIPKFGGGAAGVGNAAVPKAGALVAKHAGPPPSVVAAQQQAAYQQQQMQRQQEGRAPLSVAVFQLDQQIRQLEAVRKCHLHSKDMRSCKLCQKFKNSHLEIEKLKQKRQDMLLNPEFYNATAQQTTGFAGTTAVPDPASGAPAASTQIVASGAAAQAARLEQSKKKFHGAYDVDPANENRIKFAGEPYYGWNVMMRDQICRSPYYAVLRGCEDVRFFGKLDVQEKSKIGDKATGRIAMQIGNSGNFVLGGHLPLEVDALVSEVVDQVTSVEPHGRHESEASFLFCIAFAMVRYGVTEEELMRILEHENVFVRVCGILVLRHTLPGKDMYRCLREYLLLYVDTEESNNQRAIENAKIVDDAKGLTTKEEKAAELARKRIEEQKQANKDSEIQIPLLTPSQHYPDYEISLGEYVEELLNGDRYYSTVLPRCPIPERKKFQVMFATQLEIWRRRARMYFDAFTVNNMLLQKEQEQMTGMRNNSRFGKLVQKQQTSDKVSKFFEDRDMLLPPGTKVYAWSNQTDWLKGTVLSVDWRKGIRSRVVCLLEDNTQESFLLCDIVLQNAKVKKEKDLWAEAVNVDRSHLYDKDKGTMHEDAENADGEKVVEDPLAKMKADEMAAKALSKKRKRAGEESESEDDEEKAARIAKYNVKRVKKGDYEHFQTLPEDCDWCRVRENPLLSHDPELKDKFMASYIYEKVEEHTAGWYMPRFSMQAVRENAELEGRPRKRRVFGDRIGDNIVEAASEMVRPRIPGIFCGLGQHYDGYNNGAPDGKNMAELNPDAKFKQELIRKYQAQEGEKKNQGGAGAGPGKPFGEGPERMKLG